MVVSNILAKKHRHGVFYSGKAFIMATSSSPARMMSSAICGNTPQRRRKRPRGDDAPNLDMVINDQRHPPKITICCTRVMNDPDTEETDPASASTPEYLPNNCKRSGQRVKK